MLRLKDGIVELYRKVATSLPSDIEEALKNVYIAETDEKIKASLEGILSKIKLSRKNSTLLCEDSGIPIFFVKVPIGISYQMIMDTIVDATRIATQKIPLSPNAVDILSGDNSGDNVGTYFPLIYIEEAKSNVFTVDLMLRCAKCEKMSVMYSLPSSLIIDGQKTLAESNLDGVLKCLIEAVSKNRDNECTPFVIGIAVGGMRDQVTFLSKRQLLRRIASKLPNETLSLFEEKALHEINTLMLHPNRKVNAISVKIDTAHRHPETYFVDISFGCWANRKARLVW